jgi:hypothetical protein
MLRRSQPAIIYTERFRKNLKLGYYVERSHLSVLIFTDLTKLWHATPALTTDKYHYLLSRKADGASHVITTILIIFKR